VEALGYLDHPQAGTALVDLATDRAYALLASALLELKRQSESPQVRDALLAASHDSERLSTYAPGARSACQPPWYRGREPDPRRVVS